MLARLGVGLTNLRRALGNFGLILVKIDASQTLKKTFLASLAPCTYFLKVFGIETQNGDTQVEITADTPLSFRSSDQQGVSANRASISLSQNNLVGQNMRLRMKCQDQEEQLARQEVELKSTKRKTASKGANLAEISKKMHAAKEERVASENVNIRVN